MQTGLFQGASSTPPVLFLRNCCWVVCGTRGFERDSGDCGGGGGGVVDEGKLLGHHRQQT